MDAATITPVLTLTPTALAQVLELRAGEQKAETLALWVEVTGTNAGDYAYDLAFEPAERFEEGDAVYTQGDLTVIIPAKSIDPLSGATLDVPTADGTGGLVLRNPNKPDPLAGRDLELTGELPEKVNQLLEQMINPSLASHGGFAQLVGIEDSTAYITMGGGCQGCAASALTLRIGIERTILEHIPEITQVLDATDHDAGDNPFY